MSIYELIKKLETSKFPDCNALTMIRNIFHIHNSENIIRNAGLRLENT